MDGSRKEIMISTTDALISLINLDSKRVKPTQALVNQINNLDNKYKKEIRDWIASDKIEKNSISKLDYTDTVDKVQDKEVEEIADMFMDWDEQPEFTVALSQKLAMLKDLIPINQSVTLFGVEDMPPSTFEQSKWLLQYYIFDNPMVIFDKLNAGVLSGLEIEALEMFYPSILETLKGHLIEAIVDLKAKGINSLGMKKMKLVNIILQIPRLSPDKLQELQASFAPKEDGKTDVEVGDIQTETQRITNK